MVACFDLHRYTYNQLLISQSQSSSQTAGISGSKFSGPKKLNLRYQ